ncbi:hypothetical protein NONI108955_44605 [Nocardia ninae]
MRRWDAACRSRRVRRRILWWDGGCGWFLLGAMGVAPREFVEFGGHLAVRVLEIRHQALVFALGGEIVADPFQVVQDSPQFDIGCVGMTAVGLVHLRQLTRQCGIDPGLRVG